jgi:AcrR family transcriptional regulator
MLPRHNINFQTLKNDRRSQIMDVALEHFASNGYHNTTVNHIARHARISKGLMYLYFDSKEELLSKIVERSLNQIAEYLDPDKDGFLTEQEFELFIRKFFNVLREKRTFWRKSVKARIGFALILPAGICPIQRFGKPI